MTRPDTEYESQDDAPLLPLTPDLYGIPEVDDAEPADATVSNPVAAKLDTTVKA